MRTHLPHIASVAVIAFSLYFLSGDTGDFSRAFSGVKNEAAVFGVDNVQPQDLRAKFSRAALHPDGKIRIFIMPGHEPNYGGAEYRGLRERDINLAIAGHLQDFLSASPHYEVTLGRDDNGWKPSLERYFLERRESILEWKNEHAKIMKQLVREGEIDLLAEGVPHQKAPSNVAQRLYGINKWIGEEGFDIAIHIHINEYARRRANRPGEYSGYAIYIPERQYSNSTAARAVAESVSARLGKIFATSDLPRESGGVVEDQELVAVGSNNTADVPALLIEYGYLYESQYQDQAVRAAAIREYAYQTYLGIQDFFAPQNTDDPLVITFPRTWRGDLSAGNGYHVDAFALQLALAFDGAYPPMGKSLNDCPISGLFGPCTATALASYQDKQGITGESGYAGPLTRRAIDSSL